MKPTPTPPPPRIRPRAPALLLLVGAVGWGCGADEPSLRPGSGTRGGDTAEESGSGDNGGCPISAWETAGSLVLDPHRCVAWTSPSPALTWYAAVDPTGATLGGCTEHCDSDELNYCADLGEIEGHAGFELPDFDVLAEISRESSPLSDSGGRLWSRTSSEEDDQLAWIADLSEPGMEVLLQKDSQARALCMSGLTR